MRILVVTSRFPWPPLKGDQLILWHRLRLLGRRHELSLLSFVEDEAELAGAAELAPYCRSIDAVVLPRARALANVAAGAPFSRLPLQVLWFRSRAFRTKLDDLRRRGRFDVVHAYFHRVVPFVDGLPEPVVLDLMDSMQLRAERNAASEPPPMKWVWQEELRRMRRFEHDLPRRFARVLVVSEQDRALVGGENVDVVPNGVDADAFSPQPDRREPSTVVFSGTMSYEPNVHAIRWFADECFPRVRAAVPDARLRIAGANPSRAVAELAQRDGIEVTGFVDSMPDELNRASVSIAPMVSGSGIQNKILEAMACALPVVATTVGRGGIPAGEEQGLVVADGPEQFADAVSRLLADDARAQAIGAHGRAFVQAGYTWEANAAAVERIYAEVSGSAAPGRG